MVEKRDQARVIEDLDVHEELDATKGHVREADPFYRISMERIDLAAEVWVLGEEKECPQSQDNCEIEPRRESVFVALSQPAGGPSEEHEAAEHREREPAGEEL